MVPARRREPAEHRPISDFALGDKGNGSDRAQHENVEVTEVIAREHAACRDGAGGSQVHFEDTQDAPTTALQPESAGHPGRIGSPKRNVNHVIQNRQQQLADEPHHSPDDPEWVSQESLEENARLGRVGRGVLSAPQRAADSLPCHVVKRCNHFGSSY